MSRRRRHRLKLKSFYVWHRYMGVVAALFALVLSVSGLALNHTEELQLDERFINASWLLDWYGIDGAETAESYALADHWITLLGDRLYVDNLPLPGHFSELTGAVVLPELLLVIADGDALVLTLQGELVERLGRQNGVPAGIAEVGVRAGRPIVRAAHGLYTSDDALLDWHHTEASNDLVDWSRAGDLPAAQLHALRNNYRSHILPLERVMLDLHSGRILGNWGPWLMDAAAMLLIALALTGSWIWLTRRR
jgi:hypothetical protein